MISAILFLLQIVILAVTDGPKLVRRLKNRAERELRWRTFFWVATIGLLIYAVSIDSRPLGIMGIGLVGFLQSWTVWVRHRKGERGWARWVIWGMIIGLIVFGLCAWGVAIGLYLGWNPE